MKASVKSIKNVKLFKFIYSPLNPLLMYHLKDTKHVRTMGNSIFLVSA